jgi:mono/diheme cytochrome c family protein
MRHIVKNLLAITSLVLALYATPIHAADKSSTIIEPKITGKLMLGKLAFGTHCAACHGTQGGGTDKGPTFLHRVYHPGHHGDAAFFQAAKNGVRAHHWRFGDMAPVPAATESQIANIVKYIRALQQANGLF